MYSYVYIAFYHTLWPIHVSEIINNRNLQYQIWQLLSELTVIKCFHLLFHRANIFAGYAFNIFYLLRRMIYALCIIYIPEVPSI